MAGQERNIPSLKEFAILLEQQATQQGKTLNQILDEMTPYQKRIEELFKGVQQSGCKITIVRPIRYR